MRLPRYRMLEDDGSIADPGLWCMASDVLSLERALEEERKKPPLRVFSCDNFKGHYPVGNTIVVMATDEEVARAMIEKELKDAGLKLDGDIVEHTEPGVVTFLSGDY